MVGDGAEALVVIGRLLAMMDGGGGGLCCCSALLLGLLRSVSVFGFDVVLLLGAMFAGLTLLAVVWWLLMDVGVLVLRLGVLSLLLLLLMGLLEEGERELRPLMVTSSSKLLLELVSKRRALIHELLMGVLERWFMLLLACVVLLFIRSDISFLLLEAIERFI